MSGVATHSGLDDQFCVIPVGAELKRRSVAGSLVSLASQGVRWVLGLVATAILGRMLTPGDFGLMAMLYAVIDLAEMCMDLGLGTAMLEVRQTSSRQASTLFWLNVGLSVVMMVVLAGAAPLISLVYREPRLTEMIWVLATGFVIMGLGMQHRALLTRQLRFGALAGIEFVALAVSMIAAIGAAWCGMGYWSLVVRHFGYIVVVCGGAWLMSGWRPGRPARGSGVRGMVGFGANLTGFNLLQYLARNMDRVLLGWSVRSWQVGLYDRTCHLVLLPVAQINVSLSKVAIPALARLRDDPERYRRYYRRGVLFITTMAMPAVVLMFVAAEDVIGLLLGPQWMEATGVMRALSPGAFASTYYVAASWVYSSMGRTDRQLRWGIVTSAATVGAYVVGVRWGPVGVAAALSIVTCGLSLGPAGFAYCYRGSPVGGRDLMAALWRPAAASVGAGLGLFLAMNWAGAWGGVAMRLLFDVAVFGCGYVLLWWLLPNGRALMREFIGLVRQLRGTEEDPSRGGSGEAAVVSQMGDGR